MITLDAIELPDDLVWSDEFTWTPGLQTTSYTLTGALIVETGIKLAGRTITLTGSADAAWIDRGTLLDLQAKLTDTSAMTLTLHDSRAFQVVFDHGQKPLEAAPIIDYSTSESTDWYSLTLRLLQV